MRPLCGCAVDVRVGVAEWPSSIVLATKATAAMSPTKARILIGGLMVRFTAAIPAAAGLRQLTVQVPGVKSVPTSTAVPGPCWTAIQRPTVAVMQKSVADVALPFQPAGLSTNGEPGTVEIDE